jgi:NAD(P)-dependent dehydrogenase (short-subunit alcohol dehydrogenase family)
LNVFATFLGAIVGVKTTLAFGLWVWESWFMKQKDIVARYGKDSWAVITGGSDGIGLGIAHRLAMNKINVVLVARNETKLKEKVAEIKKLYNVKAEYRIADFGKGMTPEFYTKLEETMKDLDVSILVNNVGMGMRAFHISDAQGIWDQGIINMVPQFMMTKVFLPRFKSRTSRSCVRTIPVLLVGPSLLILHPTVLLRLSIELSRRIWARNLDRRLALIS